MKIAIVGGGISGLAAAYDLNKKLPQASLTVFESQHRLGGVLRTSSENGYLLEHAADNFLRGPTAPWAEQLCNDMSFASELIPTSNEHRGADVVWQGRLWPVPPGFQLMAPSRLLPILRSPLLSLRGKLRLCLEPLIREAKPLPRDESLTDFAVRRLGRQAFERIVQPLVSGIYTADPNQLSVRAAVPQMVEMVEQHGSLYRGMQARRRRTQQQQSERHGTRGARYGLFVAPRLGMQQWIDALAAQLTRTTIRFGASVTNVSQSQSRLADPHSDVPSDGGRQPDRPRWWVSGITDASPQSFREAFDAVILAMPTYRTGQLLRELDPMLSQQLSAIQYASSVVVALGYPLRQIARPPRTFGSVVPRREQRPILALSYTSLKFPGRAPKDRVLMRAFLGGALAPQWIDADDDQLIDTVKQQLYELLGVAGEPEICRVIRWPQAMPQYHVGHLDRLQQIQDGLGRYAGLALAGNGYRGVGIPQCVASGQRAAKQITAIVS